MSERHRVSHTNIGERFMVQGLFIGILLVIVYYVISVSRRGSSQLGSRPSKHESFTTAHSIDDALKTIIRFAQQSGYTISAIDEANGQIVLDVSASATSYGFFIPIIVSKNPDNTTLVEVGIKSKVMQAGPIVTRAHEKCFNGIKAALYAHSSS